MNDRFETVETLTAHRVGTVAFLIEPSWMKEYDHDVIFWEWGKPMQHQVVVGVPRGSDPVDYASSLAREYEGMLLIQVRDHRERAVMMNGGWLD